jgi:hypothetical protein
MAKHFQIEIADDRFAFCRNEAEIAAETARVSTAVENQATWRRDRGPVQCSFFVIGPLLCSARTDRFFVPACGLQPARAAAVKEARRAPRSGA